jgi:uncharacterized membrane protein
MWLILGIGISLRFANLAGKPIWIDEAFTLMHVSGYSNQDALRNLVSGMPIAVKTLLEYQMPHSTHSIWRTIINIADTAPELPPLYFVLLNFWMNLFGNSIWVLRSLGALLGLAIFPALYFLCLELFQLPIVAWYAITILSVSPFNLLIAQEARPYSLFSVFLLASSVFLLRAQRLQHWRAWAGWIVTTLLGLYTHLFMIVPWAVMTLYLVISERWRWGKTLRQYLIACAVVVIGFSPWLWMGFIDPSDPLNARELVQPYASLLDLVKGFIRSVSLFFIDWNLNERSPRLPFLVYMGLIGLVFMLLGYGLRYLWRYAPHRPKWFLALMIIVPLGGFLLMDLVLHSTRIKFTRYFITTGMALQIMTAYLIAAKQTQQFRSEQLWPIWQKRFLGLLMLSLLSCGVFLQSPTWWSKDRTQTNACISQAVQGKPAPIIVTDTPYARVLAIAHHLNPAVQFQLFPVGTTTPPTGALAPTFAYMPTANFLQALKTQYEVQPLCENTLWRLKIQRPAVPTVPAKE